MKGILFSFILVLVISFSFTSCKKDAKPATVTNITSLNLTANGSTMSFNDCEAATDSVNGVAQTVITGISVTNHTLGTESFEVDILHDVATLKVGQTYPISSSVTQPDGATLYYLPNDTDVFVTQPNNPQGSVNITGITPATITGTFSGMLFAPNDLSGTTVLYTVTNGSFIAQRAL